MASDSLTIDEQKAIEIIAGGLGLPTKAGSRVSFKTGMGNSTVYRCVALLAGSIGSLPCEVFEKKSAEEKEPRFDHPVYALLHDEPNAKQTAAVFWEAVGLDYFLRGNGYALIGRNRNGDPKELLWAPEDMVEPSDNHDYTRLIYKFTLPGGRVVKVDQDDVLHFPNLGWDGKRGGAPLEFAREAIGLGLAQEEFTARYFGQGISSDLAITYPNELKPEAVETLKKYLRKRQAGPKNAHAPLIVTSGGKVESLARNSKDAQLVESRTFQAEEICRVFGVPPHLAMIISKTSSWGSGITEQTLGFVKFSLRPHVRKFEQECKRKLLRRPELICKFNMDALLRADPKTRAELYKVALGGTQNPAYMTPNEVREKEGMPPREDGDELAKPKDHQDSGGDDDPDQTDPADPRRWMKGSEDEE